MPNLLARKELALNLWAQLNEKKHACIELHARARTLLEQDKFEDATRCCQESYRLGLEMGDSYVRAAARLYSGLILLALKDPVHWDRAGNYCEESAALFHAVGERAAEGAAWWAVAQIADAQTAEGYDRIQRALPAYLHVMSPDAESPEQLESLARTAYGEAVSRMGAGDGKVPRIAPSEPPSEPPLASPPLRAEPLPLAPVLIVHANARSRVGAPIAMRARAPLEVFALGIYIFDFLAVVALAGVMAWEYLLAHPNLQLVIVFLGSVLLAATFVPLAILASSGQFVFQIGARQAAVLRAHGTMVADERRGWHLVMPFVESLDVMMPLGRRQLTNRLFDIQSSDGFSFLARATVVYRVTDAVAAWSQLCSAVPFTRIGGIPQVVSRQHMEQVIDDWALQFISKALHQLASVPTQRASLQTGEFLNRATLAQLQAETLFAGLQFYTAEVTPYHRA